ncbi:MAG: hypothetical protein IJ365_04905 [Clostridia bacterium]|nr:hypothetical protein [Clostridia bacterium]
MDTNELWQRFYTSGRVDHYLEYAMSTTQKAGYNDGTDKNKRADTEGSEPQ